MTTSKKRVTIKISAKLHRKLVQFRAQTGLSISNIVRLAVAQVARGKRGGIVGRPHRRRGGK